MTEAQNDTIEFEGCGVDVYYSTITHEEDETQWFKLLNSTHRNVLPTIGAKGEKNVFHALVDLDPGYNETGVRLYMRNMDFPAYQYNTPEGWRRGDLWPKVRGASLGTPAGTDVHSKRPIDWEVNAAVEKLFWGTCGTVKGNEFCVNPAIPGETAPTTAQDGEIKTPPENMRGDVARAVFYTALRYSGDFGFRLTDCPPFSSTEYGYKSELLKWHAADPVDERERARNDKACRQWQGNRNPFIDRPELVTTLFGEPVAILQGTGVYLGCPTDSPTATPTTSAHTDSPTATPTDLLTATPTDLLTAVPTNSPTATPTTSAHTDSPTATPTDLLTATPTDLLTAVPTNSPTATPDAHSPTVFRVSSGTLQPSSTPLSYILPADGSEHISGGTIAAVVLGCGLLIVAIAFIAFVVRSKAKEKKTNDPTPIVAEAVMEEAQDNGALSFTVEPLIVVDVLPSSSPKDPGEQLAQQAKGICFKHQVGALVHTEA